MQYISGGFGGNNPFKRLTHILTTYIGNPIRYVQHYEAPFSKERKPVHAICDPFEFDNSLCIQIISKHVKAFSTE